MFCLGLLFSLAGLIKGAPSKYNGLYGSNLRNALKNDYRSHKDLGYKGIREELYGICFNKSGRNSVPAWYSNEMLSYTYGSTNLNQNSQLNAEHIVPQSLFNKGNPMVSDGHHIRPCSLLTNSARANLKFIESSPSKCTTFYKDGKATSSYSGDANAYSCLVKGSGFYPRSEVRGQTARAIAYFYTVYPEYISTLPSTISSADLIVKWNNSYGVNSAEKSGHDCIASVQGNSNPYILYPDLVARAFCDKSSSGCSAYTGEAEYKAEEY